MPARATGHCECLLDQGHSPVLCGMAPWPLGPIQAPVPSTNTQYQYQAPAPSTYHQYPAPGVPDLGSLRRKRWQQRREGMGRTNLGPSLSFSATLACFYSFLITSWLLRVTSLRTLSSSVCCLAPTGRPPLGTPARFTKKGGESVAGWRETELSYLDI